MTAERAHVILSLRPVAVSRADAAAALGLGLSAFEARVQPGLRVLRIGTRVLVPVGELEAWVERNAERVL